VISLGRAVHTFKEWLVSYWEDDDDNYFPLVDQKRSIDVYLECTAITSIKLVKALRVTKG